MYKLKLSREQTLEYHRDMWNFIAEKSLNEKRCVSKVEYLWHLFDTCEWFTFPSIVNNCFCCEYGKQQSRLNLVQPYFSMCNYCPIDWSSSANHFMCCDRFGYDDNLGLFSIWENFTKVANWEYAANAAKLISKLPERTWNK